MRWFAALLLAVSTGAFGATADEVVAAARAANRIDSSIQDIKMVVVDKNGSERVREMEIRTRRDGEVVKSYLRIESPSDVAGTQLLQIDDPTAADEQLLYLPAFKRTNRISGKSRKGNFVGSDFTYEDLSIRDAAEGSHTLVDEAGEVWVIDTDPGEDSSYKRIRATITKADHVARKIEFFDSDNELLKVLEVNKTATEGEIVLPVESVMKNVKKGTQTQLHIQSHRLNITEEELPSDTFTKEYMERSG